jgi:DNA-binding protein HU-beta
MNKKELVDEIAKKTKLTKKVVDDVLITFMDVTKKTLKKKDKITLVGFGTFQVRHRKATTGINPQTKEKMDIPAKNYAKLQFSDKVNERFCKLNLIYFWI